MRLLTGSWWGGALMAGLLAWGAARAADNETLFLRTPWETPVFLELPPSLAQGGDAQVVATLGLLLDTP